ncbi:beta-ketoacyl synthase N-terminal-like domain-containing protein [Kitasatospora sp. NBC_00458]|uniref:beta-ketoacyl synthase N-terminal-like domain-containing protein n=1 Tax=Kitasatospora sp. NBC_00458 TaxID=2903568 RepID=UPI002E197F39
MSDVIVTGTGVVSPAGLGTEPLWSAMAAGRSFFDPAGPLPWPVAAVDRGSVQWPPGKPWIDNRKYANLAAYWAVEAARLALRQAGRDPDAPDGPGWGDPERGGTVMAVGSTGDELGDVMPRLAGMALDDPRPLATLLYEEVPDYSYIRGIPSQLGQFVCMTTGFRGSNVAAYGEVAAGGLGALALALRLLESGELDRVLVVGVAPPSSVSALASFDRDEPIGTEAAPGRGPFDEERAGPLLGQGAAAVLLERAAPADAPAPRALARLLACETVVAADRASATGLAVRAALRRAGGRPDLWWAHGSGSPAADREECSAVLPQVGAVPVTSSKGTLGLALECSALIDTALAVESLRRGQLPPVGLLRRPDPRLGGPDTVTGAARPVPGLGTALVTGIDHGRGTASAGALVLGGVTGDPRDHHARREEEL